MTQPLPRRLVGALALCFLSAAAAHADSETSLAATHPMPAARSLSAGAIARQHWRAISQGDVTTLMWDYSPEAVFHWKEGAFEGDHIGAEAIRTVWIKFAKVRAPLMLTVQNVQDNGGSHGSRIVTADVTFRNMDWTYPLAYRIVFRAGKIVEETWQLAEPDIDPALGNV